jgi:DNA-binding transcriptional LysR family regulator
MQIQCFLKAAQNLNFTQSAAEMFISQPAFSHNISALEEEWGIKLFARDNKRKDTQLTPAGAIMYDGLKSLREQFENLLQKAQSAHQENRVRCESDSLAPIASTRGRWFFLIDFRRSIRALICCCVAAVTVS